MANLLELIEVSLWRKLVTSPPTSLDLGFLSTDLKNQINNARSLIEQIGKLQEIVNAIPDDSLRVRMENEIRGLLQVATKMNANITFTTASSTSALTPDLITTIYLAPKKQ